MNSDIQRMWVDAILEMTKENDGIPPSVRELGKRMGLRSTSTVHWYLTQLRKDGVVTADPVWNRAIRICPEHVPKGTPCPMCGR